MNIEKNHIVPNNLPRLLFVFVIVVISFVMGSLLMFRKTTADQNFFSPQEASLENSLQQNNAAISLNVGLLAETRTVQDISNDPLVIQDKASQEQVKILSSDVIIFYVNSERQKKGLEPLFVNQALVLAAEQKVKSMFDEQYFEHISPKGEGMVHWIGSAYDYIAVGENLAMGNFGDEQEIVRAWMNSQKHRETILKASYIQTGIAVKRGNYKGEQVVMIVQIFGVPASLCPKADEKLFISAHVYENSLKDAEEKIAFLHKTITDMPQPITKAERTEFSSLVSQYNYVVSKRASILDTLKKITSAYNEQVEKHNVCASEKQGVFAQ